MKLDQLWKKGAELYKRGHAFEAHEVWEQGWLAMPRRWTKMRAWWQGWILMAGVDVLTQKGRKSAAQTMLKNAKYKLKTGVRYQRRFAL